MSMPTAHIRTSLDTSREAQTVTHSVGSERMPQQSDSKAGRDIEGRGWSETELKVSWLVQTLDKAKLPEDYSGRRCEMLSAN